MKKLCILLLLLTFLLSSCAQTQNGMGQKEMIGTGAGAAIGALIGQAIGLNTASTLIGAAAGGLLGYAIATQVKVETNQVHNQQETQKLVANGGKGKTTVQVHSEKIEPTNKFHAGENVTVLMSYIILDKEQKMVPVHEKKTLWYQGTEQAVFEDTTINRENGTWESKITFQLPEDVQKGQYQVRQDIESGQVADTSLVQFTVI